ncbi:MAG: 50S ribosomal protein L2 [Pseudomonadota bacterium]
MPLKSIKPTTPGQRDLVIVSRAGLHKGPPVKALTRGLKKTGGRNNTGRITVRHRGQGHKRAYRQVDFRRNRFGQSAKVIRLEYDPGRSAHIALVDYGENDFSYILAPAGLKAGDQVVSSDKEQVDIRPGNAMPLRVIPVGSIVHNIELKPGGGGRMARAAGSSAQLAGHDGGRAQLKLSSGELRMVDSRCMATVGTVSNSDHQNVNHGKAGRNRWRGRRPTVRGVAMNPVDHPHGGGEGRTSGGRHPVTPWGKPTKGYRTRPRKKASDRMIIRRRHRRK